MKRKIEINIPAILAIAVAVCLDMSCSNHGDPQPVDCSTLSIEVPTANKIIPTGCTTIDGSITAVASGGKEPYQYSINGGTSFQEAALFNNLTSGTYDIMVKDANLCTKTIENVSLASAASTLLVSETSVSTAGCKTNTGTIQATASGGQEPYQYSINGSSFFSSPIFSSVPSGNYTVTIKDALGCTATKSGVKVTSGVSYTTQIKPILQTNCIKSGCHDGGGSLPNWSNLSTVQARAATIKAKVLDGSMPKDGTLTQSQKDLIACWVDDGALNN